MKNTLLVVGLCLTAICNAAFADGPIGPPVDDRLLRAARERDAAARIAQRDPRVAVPSIPPNYRTVGDNAVVNLSEIEVWEQSKGAAGTAAGGKPLPGWFHITGIVLDNKDGYVVIYNPHEVVLSGTYRGVGQLWVRDAPQYPMPVRTKITWFLKTTARTWSTEGGGSAMECKYGTPLTTEQVKAMFRAPAVRQKTVEEMSAETLRILTYQLSQASNGLPSFQLLMGKRYLTGEGVETNLALARHWLNAACTNGEPIATNLLSRLQ